MKRGRKRYQSSKAITPTQGFNQNFLRAQYGWLADDPVFIDVLLASNLKPLDFIGPSKDAVGDFTDVTRSEALERLTKVAREAFLKCDYSFFKRVAQIQEALAEILDGDLSSRATADEILFRQKRYAQAADPNLTVLADAWRYLFITSGRSLPTRAATWTIASKWKSDFTIDAAQFSRYCTKLGLKFDSSKRRRGKTKHGE